MYAFSPICSNRDMSENEFIQMENNGYYPHAEDCQFDHYKISVGIGMHYEDYSWDAFQGVWIFNIDGLTYIVEDL